MSYNILLDTWFDYPWLSYGVPVLIFCVMAFFRERLSHNKEYTWLIHAAYYSIPFLLILTTTIFNSMYLGYGSPAGVTDIRYVDGNLYVVDYIGTWGTRYTSGEPCYRIHVLDAESGKKILRFRIGFDATLIGVSGDSIAVAHYSDVGYYSRTTGELLTTFSSETLPGIYPQLSAGVSRFMWGDGRNIMEISSLDGKEWNLFTKTRQLVPATTEVTYQPTKKLFIRENDILTDDQPSGSYFVRMHPRDNNTNEKYSFDSRDSLLNAETFLDGRPVAVDEVSKSFIILHYETMTRERCILTSMGFKGEKNWDLNQTALYPLLTFKNENVPQVDLNESGNRIFLNLGDNILSIQLPDGSISWKQNLSEH